MTSTPSFLLACARNGRGTPPQKVAEAPPGRCQHPPQEAFTVRDKGFMTRISGSHALSRTLPSGHRGERNERKNMSRHVLPSRGSRRTKVIVVGAR
jgi:hypothetical protein